MKALPANESASPPLLLTFLAVGSMTTATVQVDVNLLRNQERAAFYSGHSLDMAVCPESSGEQVSYPVRAFLPFAVAYEERIAQLEGYLKEDGLTLDRKSESDFWSLMESMFFTRKAGLVLLEDGTLRAIWKDNRGNRLALLFHGNGTAQYVVFVRQFDAPTLRKAGTVPLNGIKALIEGYGLAALVQQT